MQDLPPPGFPLPPFLGIARYSAARHHGRDLPEDEGQVPAETSPSAYIRNSSGGNVEQLFASSFQRDTGPPRYHGAFEALRAHRTAWPQDDARNNAVVDWVIILARTSCEAHHLHAVFRTSLQPTQWHYIGGSFLFFSEQAAAFTVPRLVICERALDSVQVLMPQQSHSVIAEL